MPKSGCDSGATVQPTTAEAAQARLVWNALFSLWAVSTPALVEQMDKAPEREREDEQLLGSPLRQHFVSLSE